MKIDVFFCYRSPNEERSASNAIKYDRKSNWMIYVCFAKKPIECLLLQIPFNHFTCTFINLLKVPNKMAEPKPINWTMWVFFSINELMMISMRVHPSDWIALFKKYIKYLKHNILIH